MAAASKRDKALDCICGILIIRMMLWHIFQWSQLTGSCFYRCMYLLYFSMPWFFFKAGMFYKDIPVRQAVAGGLRRLLLPFAAMSLAGHALLCVRFAVEGGHPWQHFLLSPLKEALLLGSVSGNLPLWFLLSLFLVRVLYSLLAVRFKARPACIAALSCLCCLLLYRLRVCYPCYFPNAACGLFFFSLGRLLKDVQYKKPVAVLAALVYALALAFAPSFVDMRSSALISGHYAVWIAGAAAGIVALNNAFRLAGERLPRALCAVGFHSMVFYIFHWLFITAVRTAACKIPALQSGPCALAAYMGG